MSANPTQTKKNALATPKDAPQQAGETVSIEPSFQNRISQSRRRILLGVTLQIIVLAMMAIVSLLYYRTHSLSWPFPSTEEVTNFNFIGVAPGKPEPSFLAVIIEIFLWSATGVLAKSEYSLTQLIVTRKDFDAFEQMSKIIGELIMGVSITISVIAFFRSVELNVAQISLSLKAANIETIIAISFIFGFYHDQTRRLLGVIQKRVTETAMANKESKDSE